MSLDVDEQSHVAPDEDEDDALDEDAELDEALSAVDPPPTPADDPPVAAPPPDELALDALLDVLAVALASVVLAVVPGGPASCHSVNGEPMQPIKEAAQKHDHGAVRMSR